MASPSFLRRGLGGGFGFPLLSQGEVAILIAGAVVLLKIKTRFILNV